MTNPENGTPRSGTPRLTKGLRAERDGRVLELRLAGASIRAVAEQVGLSKSQVDRIEKAQLRLHAGERREATELAIVLEEMRLDRLFEALWPSALTGDLPAVDRVLKIMERRAKLLGLDRPAQVELSAERFVVHIDAAQLPPPMDDVADDA